MWKAVLILLLLTGCANRRIGLELRADDDVYTRADIDALNAVVACKLAARTMVQIARCEVRR